MMTKNDNIDYSSINLVIKNNITKILDALGIDYKSRGKRINFACPIHGGSDVNSGIIYINNNNCLFMCFVGNCQNQIGYGMIHFISAVLKKDFKSTINWICNVCNAEVEYVNSSDIELLNFISTVNVFEKNKPCDKRNLDVSRLQIPSKYYIDRGYSYEVLKHFHVGYCNEPSHEMYNRIVVPVFNTKKEVLGLIGRNPNQVCAICQNYHKPNKMCPMNDLEERWSLKWINSRNFHTGNHLYNIWNSWKTINDTQNIILVEGAGDVWRLEEAGIKNSVALFGCNLTENQCKLLEHLNLQDVYLALDNDTAGNEAKEKIEGYLNRLYNVHYVDVPHKDIGEIKDLNKVRDIFKGIKCK